MYPRILAMLFSFAGLSFVSANTMGADEISIEPLELVTDNGANEWDGSDPLIISDTRFDDQHDSEVELPAVPALPEGLEYEPLEIEQAVRITVDETDVWVLPSEMELQAIEDQIEQGILTAEYDYREQSQRVVALQELVGAEPDGNYGPRTREAHLRVLNEREMTVDNVPELPTGGVYMIPNTTWSDGVEQWRPMMTEAVMAWGGTENDVNRFMRIMHCESRGDPNAYNRSSAASGLLQHLQKYWPGRAATVGMPDASPFDPWANMYVSAWLALAAPGGGWQHWECK